jgi:hypothetical protein
MATPEQMAQLRQYMAQMGPQQPPAGQPMEPEQNGLISMISKLINPGAGQVQQMGGGLSNMLGAAMTPEEMERRRRMRDLLIGSGQGAEHDELLRQYLPR